MNIQPFSGRNGYVAPSVTEIIIQSLQPVLTTSPSLGIDPWQIDEEDINEGI